MPCSQASVYYGMRVLGISKTVTYYYTLSQFIPTGWRSSKNIIEVGHCFSGVLTVLPASFFPLLRIQSMRLSIV